MEKRTLLAIALSVVVVFAYQFFFAPKPMPRQPAAPPGAIEAPHQQAKTPQPATDTAAAPAPAEKSTRTAVAQKAGLEKDVTVDTPLYRAVFTTRGGALRSFQLKQFKTKLDKNAGPIELVNSTPNMPLPLSVSFVDSSILASGSDLYESDRSSVTLSKTDQKTSLAFSQTYPGSVRIEKIFTFSPNDYAIRMELKVHNLSPATIQQNATLTWFQYDDPAVKKDNYAHDGPVFYMDKSVTFTKLADLKGDEHHGPDISWSGYDSKYFIAAMLPQNPALTSLILNRDPHNVVSVQLKGPKNIIPAGQNGLFAYTLYLGPKDYSIMKGLNVGLENAIDFGSWVKWLAMPLLIVLKFIYKFAGNYGIAIIILTILIKIIFWPLGNKSYKSMKEMQKLQPKMQELREKYKDDKQKLSQETMALYKTHKVNPLGGCLPILIQIPVFFGLYKVLLYAIELRHSPFFFWIQDLSAKDPYYITPIVMGATMFIQQKMTPTMGDPMQAKIMLLMPVVFTFLFLNFPSGLVLYWLFNNIISIGQQVYINKHV
ncbi:MAG TPA: membrane protein insertase YidC [Syntrophales bacterium]|nr:membrane protein insertase YidC [Syntrophales bacterium]